MLDSIDAIMNNKAGSETCNHMDPSREERTRQRAEQVLSSDTEMLFIPKRRSEGRQGPDDVGDGDIVLIFFNSVTYGTSRHLKGKQYAICALRGSLHHCLSDMEQGYVPCRYIYYPVVSTGILKTLAILSIPMAYLGAEVPHYSHLYSLPLIP